MDSEPSFSALGHVKKRIWKNSNVALYRYPGGKGASIIYIYSCRRTAKIRSSLPGQLPPQRRFAAIISSLTVSMC